MYVYTCIYIFVLRLRPLFICRAPSQRRCASTLYMHTSLILVTPPPPPFLSSTPTCRCNSLFSFLDPSHIMPCRDVSPLLAIIASSKSCDVLFYSLYFQPFLYCTIIVVTALGFLRTMAELGLAPPPLWQGATDILLVLYFIFYRKVVIAHAPTSSPPLPSSRCRVLVIPHPSPPFLLHQNQTVTTFLRRRRSIGSTCTRRRAYETRRESWSEAPTWWTTGPAIRPSRLKQVRGATAVNFQKKRKSGEKKHNYV